MVNIKENLIRCLEQIERAAVKSGKKGSDITLVAVTKMVDPARINEGIEAGIKIIGENKVQEAQAKKAFVKPVTWHMVGHLQTNKTKQALTLFDMIQSVDSLHLAKEISKYCQNLHKNMPILIEVNTSGEPTKFGCKPQDTVSLVSEISQLPGLQVKGLMTIGAFTSEKEKIRSCFILLRQLFEKIVDLKLSSVDMGILSMGMSSDFELAIEEGATMVRLGTAIFGERNYAR